MPSIVQSSTDYEMFSMLEANRMVNQAHVNNLIEAFQEIGNLTERQPILVNENFEIIDGQHRFTACKELNQPVYFTVQPGLRVSDAVKLNVLHRAWTAQDYAESYAAMGNINYLQLLNLKEDHGVSISTALLFARGSDERGIFKRFRAGELIIDDYEAAKARLDKYTEAAEALGRSDGFFGRAYLRVMKVPGFDQERMVRKLAQVGSHYLLKFTQVSEYMRALEEVYNYGFGENNRLRLY